MLTYETISEALLDSAEQADLNVWQTDEQLDPQTLTRTFALNCVPQGIETPRPHTIRALMSFKWDAGMTAISVLGTEGMCEKYHGTNVACSHTLIGCAYETNLALEIEYQIPLSMVLGEDVSALQRLVRGVQELHRGLIDHQNIVSVKAEVHFDTSGASVRGLTATQRWTVGDPIHELDALKDVLEEACSEVRDMHMALVERFSSPALDDFEDLPPLALPPELQDEDRIYLRPPTA